MALLQHLQAWHWIVLGLLMFGAEALGASGFLIGAGAAALMQALISWLFPEMGWQSQLLTFAIMAAVFTVAYWRFFRQFNERTDHQIINDRAAQLIGRRLTLAKDLAVGQDKIQIGDTFWKVNCAEPLAKGQEIEITSAEKMVLTINKIS